MTSIPPGMNPWTSTRACMRDWCTNGVGGPVFIKEAGAQDVVYCAGPAGIDDLHYAGWNVPRHESGKAVRPLGTRPGIAPSKRARVLQRDNCTCVVCHRADTPIDVGHLISRNTGTAMGLTDNQIESDENLAAMCATCNSGIGDEPVPLRFMVALLRARLEHQKHTPPPAGPDTLFDA